MFYKNKTQRLEKIKYFKYPALFYILLKIYAHTLISQSQNIYIKKEWYQYAIQAKFGKIILIHATVP